MFNQKELSYVLEKNNFIPIVILLSSVSTIIDAISLSSLIPIFLSITDFSLIEVYSPEYFLPYINKYSQKEIIIIFISFSLFFFVIKTLFSIFVNWKINSLCYDQLKILRSRIFDKIVNLNYLNFINKNQDDYISTIINTTHEFIEMNLRPYMRLISEMIVISAFSLILIFNFALEFISLIIFLGFFIFFYIFFIKKRLELYGEISDKNNSKFIEFINYNFEGKFEIDNLSLKNIFSDKTKGHLNLLIDSKKKSVLFEIIPRYLIELVIVSALLLIIFLGYVLFDDTKTFVSITVIALISVRLMPSINIIMISITQLKFSIFHSQKLSNLISEIENTKIINIKKPKFNFDIKKIEFKNISFKYNNSLKIIDNFSTTINSNRITSIYGQSGSGKSTLIKILLGILKPNEGIIKINDKDWDNMYNLHDKFFYLKQDPFLMNDTVLNNISLFKDLDTKDVINIKKSLIELNLVNQMEDTDSFMNLNIGNRGNKISGGQRQRLLMARAIFFNKKIIIMDEPTSSLDSTNIDNFIELIKSLKNRFTFILVTHDSSFLDPSDSVINIKNN